MACGTYKQHMVVTQILSTSPHTGVIEHWLGIAVCVSVCARACRIVDV